MNSLQLILASSSPRRKKLLTQIGWPFMVIPSKVKEIFPDENPETAVQSLARQKAESVADGKTDSLVIAADTIVVLDGRVLGQPGSSEEAMEMLKSLSGRSHDVYTGVYLIRTDQEAMILNQLSFYEQTKVHFAALEKHEMKRYIDSGSPMDKAGAYGIQDDWGALFVSRIDGDYYNVVGLPLHKLYQQMKLIAPDFLKQAYTQAT
jgi:septum formation protein